jgi:hypothetical protein
MECFKVRREFADFWRGTLDAAPRRKLIEHLKVCAGCDRAFRVFALSAPALHSDFQPVGSGADDGLRGLPIAPRKLRTWIAATAMGALAMAATVAVYLAVAPPAETLDEALSPADSIGEIGPSNPLDLTIRG